MQKLFLFPLSTAWQFQDFLGKAQTVHFASDRQADKLCAQVALLQQLGWC